MMAMDILELLSKLPHILRIKQDKFYPITYQTFKLVLTLGPTLYKINLNFPHK